MIPNSVKLWQNKCEEARNLLQTLFVETEFLKDDIYALPPEELTDIGYLFRETAGFLDGARKEYNSKRELIELLLCKSSLESGLSEGFEKGEKLTVYRGVLASCRPSIKIQPKIPKRGSEEYQALCKWAGIPEEEIAKGYVTFHFPTLTEMLTKNAEHGKPNPPGITEVMPKYSVIFRKRNGN